MSDLTGNDIKKIVQSHDYKDIIRGASLIKGIVSEQFKSEPVSTLEGFEYTKEFCEFEKINDFKVYFENKVIGVGWREIITTELQDQWEDLVREIKK